MQYIDIGLLLVTLIFAYLLYSRLGKRTGTEKKPFGFSQGFTGSSDSIIQSTSDTEKEVNTPLITALKQLQNADSKFDQYSFIEKAKSKFETILKAFIGHDEDTLRSLLTPDLYKAYKDEIAALKSKKVSGELLFFRMVAATLKEILIESGIATLKVHFISEQTQVQRNKKGDIIEGDPHGIERISEIWAFERKLKSKDKWLLADISPYSPS